MKLRSKVASALSFAHLAGLSMRAKAEDEDDRKDDVEGDEPEKKDQDRENGDSKKGKKARRAEDEKDDKSAEGDDSGEDEDDEKDKPSGRKAEDEDPEAEDDDEDEMRGTSAAAKARRRERARCAAIFASKAAGKNPALAANLAFNTSMTRKEAIVVLESSPAAEAPTSSSRSARNPGLGAGGSTQGNSKQAVASRWDAAFAKASPRRG